MSERLRVAAIITIYHPKAHADVIVTKFLKGMSTDEGFLPPEIDIVSIYLDHVLENDIGVGLAEEYDVPIYPSIRRALHAGANELNVDAEALDNEKLRRTIAKLKDAKVIATLRSKGSLEVNCICEEFIIT